MNLSVSVLQPQRLLWLVRTPIDVLRVAAWSFALLGLMFFVPEEGFNLILWHDPFGVSFHLATGVLMAMILKSMLPAVILLEVWVVNKRTDVELSKGGLVIFALIALFSMNAIGMGLPLIYASYLKPNSYVTAVPYLMVLGGFTVWAILMSTRRLLIKKT
ncbi:MAG: hypothetical protein ACE5G0_05680 [Rhodothermales bacterium]